MQEQLTTLSKQILKLTEVKNITGLSGSSIYRGASNNTFPKPIKLGLRSSGFIKSEIDQWIEDRINASRNGEALK
jgi:prophage regulatory protein